MSFEDWLQASRRWGMKFDRFHLTRTSGKRSTRFWANASIPFRNDSSFNCVSSSPFSREEHSSMHYRVLMWLIFMASAGRHSIVAQVCRALEILHVRAPHGSSPRAPRRKENQKKSRRHVDTISTTDFECIRHSCAQYRGVPPVRFNLDLLGSICRLIHGHTKRHLPRGFRQRTRTRDFRRSVPVSWRCAPCTLSVAAPCEKAVTTHVRPLDMPAESGPIFIWSCCRSRPGAAAEPAAAAEKMGYTDRLHLTDRSTMIESMPHIAVPHFAFQVDMKASAWRSPKHWAGRSRWSSVGSVIFLSVTEARWNRNLEPRDIARAMLHVLFEPSGSGRDGSPG